MCQLQYLIVLGVPIPYLCTQFQCLSLSMSSVWVISLILISGTQLDGIVSHSYYSVPYCNYIAESCCENHVSTVNITVCAILPNLGNTDYVVYLLFQANLRQQKQSICVMHHVWDMTCYLQCNDVLFLAHKRGKTFGVVSCTGCTTKDW